LEVRISPLEGIKRVKPGDELAGMIISALRRKGFVLEDGDIVVVTQKIVSKSEGRLAKLNDVKPTEEAVALAAELGKDPRVVELVLRESKRVVRKGHGVLITETRHGFVCANAGIDASNVEAGYVALLPLDSDASARRIRRGLEKMTSKRLAVIVTDTFGRPWREGQTDVAIGCSGIAPTQSLAGKKDPYGYVLRVTQPAIVDEVAAAAELVMKKRALVPVAIVSQGRVGREEHGQEEGPRPLQVSGLVGRTVDRLVALSGGTGSAKFLRGLQKLARFTVVANVGDNAWFHGLYVCPDIDTVTYTLAGIEDAAKGWGIMGDEFKTLAQLKRLGAEGTWFNIGDLDMATHLFRTTLMRQGKSLTEATSRIALGLGVHRWKILPATDQHVETRIITAEKGEMHLQEFWVKEKGRPRPTGVRYVGARHARVSAQVKKSIASSDRIIVCPANPITSIMPMLSIGGFREALRGSNARKVAVSPMIGEGAYSGPAGWLMAAKKLKSTSEGVAKLYRGVVDAMIVDESDRPQARAIEKAGVSCYFTSTLMRSGEDEVRLAKVAMEV
jgi:LPPG:FO 2-phospho-L-lactate transferase